MSGTGNIRYLVQKEIDKARWDQCIDNAANGLIYAYSFYLDTMSKNWDALVLNDYEAVMPLTWNSKFGIRYLYQPFLTAQSGVFGTGFNEYTRNDFLNAVPPSFRYIDIALNSGNILSVPSGFETIRSNYTLNMHRPYNDLFDNYNENTKRNIKKALQEGFTIARGFDVEKVITLAIAQMKEQGHEPAENVQRFRKLYSQLLQKKMATTYGVLSGETLLASCVFFFSHKRAYYILVGNSYTSRDKGASHALIDAFIKDNAGKDLILDFEGSDIQGLAAFYRGFGAMHEPYPALRINRLPFYLRWMKQ